MEECMWGALGTVVAWRWLSADVLEDTLGRAGRESPASTTIPRDTASLVVRSQVGLSAGVLRGQRHLKIAQVDGVRKPRQGDG